MRWTGTESRATPIQLMAQTQRLDESMQYLLALALAGVAAWLISTTGAGSIERAVSAIAQLVGGWRPDPWPAGVQEEDRDRPWGSRTAHPAAKSLRSIDESVTPVPATRVSPRTRAR